MGVSGSAPATPRNRHLAHVSDPRSPSAGILRTPIEVLSSPADSPQLGAAEPEPATGQGCDPRSPTPGISRTPMRTAASGKRRCAARVGGLARRLASPARLLSLFPPPPADSVEHLVKQLSEAFGMEAAARQPAPPGAGCGEAAEEPAWRNAAPAAAPEPAACTVEQTERPPSPAATPQTIQIQDPFCDPLMCFLLSPGSKPVRRKANNKIMASSAGTGRSPLSILQDDNSPSAPASRQGKRHVLGENLGEKEVTADLSRNLKPGNCAWSNLNKENQQCPFVEN
ncbi:CDCA3 protein, partial [Urocolius indicus]|nr:CDCA3 protein [Urocolius indicus]